MAPYVGVPGAGAILAAVPYLTATGEPGSETSGFAANGCGNLSPGKHSPLACLLIKVACTFFFLMIIMGVKSSRGPDGFAPLPIGFALTLIHLISIPVTNTSVNPARSTNQALFGGFAYIGQLWLFWLAPIAGALLARGMHQPEQPPLSDADSH